MTRSTLAGWGWGWGWGEGPPQVDDAAVVDDAAELGAAGVDGVFSPRRDRTETDGGLGVDTAPSDEAAADAGSPSVTRAVVGASGPAPLAPAPGPVLTALPVDRDDFWRSSCEMLTGERRSSNVRLRPLAERCLRPKHHAPRHTTIKPHNRKQQKQNRNTAY